MRQASAQWRRPQPVASTEVVTADVAALLESYGGRLRWIHARGAGRLAGSNGFPDFLICGPGGVLYRECKPRRDSRLAPEQTAWRYALLGAGTDYAVWTQQDLDDGTIKRQLDALAAR